MSGPAGSTSRQDPAFDIGAPLQELADTPVFTLFQRLAASPRGLTESEAAFAPIR